MSRFKIIVVVNVLINLGIYKHLHWEATKNQSLDDICWNLLTLTLGDEFDQNIEGVAVSRSTPDYTPRSIVSGISTSWKTSSFASHFGMSRF